MSNCVYVYRVSKKSSIPPFFRNQGKLGVGSHQKKRKRCEMTLEEDE